MADVRFSVEYEQRPSVPYASQVTLTGPLVAIAWGDRSLSIAGMVENRGPLLTYWNRAVVLTRRADQRVIGCDVGYVQGSRVRFRDGTITDTGLRAGELAPFTIDSLAQIDDDPRSLTFTGWAVWDEGRGVEAERRTVGLTKINQ